VRISIIIPTHNSENHLNTLLKSLEDQSLKGVELIVIDTASTDNTLKIAKSYNANIIKIKLADFTHGHVRNLSGKSATGDILVYLTDDAAPVDNDSIDNLISSFRDPRVAAVGGRQIPNKNSKPFGRHLRLFNYPESSFCRTYSDKHTLGFKTIFLSNSFAAYRRVCLEKIGWFEKDAIFGEDSLACALLLKAGYRICYQSSAMVYHSHDYSILEEFKRYFDIGVFHKKEDWLLKEFGAPTAEGVKYTKSLLIYLLKNKHYFHIIGIPFRIIAKFLGYRLGLYNNIFPQSLVRKLSKYGRNR
jgi:rhamnosyltransferase